MKKIKKFFGWLLEIGVNHLRCETEIPKSCSEIKPVFVVPKRPVVRGIYGRIDDGEWLLTDPAIRRAALNIVRQVKASTRKSA